MKKLYDFLKYLIYGSSYLIVIKTAMDYYAYKREPGLFRPLVYGGAAIWGGLPGGHCSVCDPAMGFAQKNEEERGKDPRSVL